MNISMHSKIEKKVKPLRSVLVVLVGVALTFMLLGHRQMLAYIALFACDHGSLDVARGIAHRCLELDRSDHIAVLVISESFQQPLQAAMHEGNYQEAMDIVESWQEYTDGRDALPYFWKASIWKGMGNTNLAGEALIDAMIVHDQNPEQQQLGFLRIFNTTVSLVGESNCLTNLSNARRERRCYRPK